MIAPIKQESLQQFNPKNFTSCGFFGAKFGTMAMCHKISREGLRAAEPDRSF